MSSRRILIKSQNDIVVLLKSWFFSLEDTIMLIISPNYCAKCRVSVQGVKSHGGHFACLCREFDFYEVKKNIIIFQKEKEKENMYFYAFNHFYSEKSSKRVK